MPCETRTVDVPAGASGVLSQPTRARLFALLGELRRPAGTDELAERAGLHPNGVRLHLERLREAGLVARDRRRGARGRPRDEWSVSAEAAPGGERPSAYADLSRWLARAIDEEGRGVEEVGRAIGRELAPGAEPGNAPEALLMAALSAMGFRPRALPGPPGERRYRLDNCPYRDAAAERRDTVCRLHRGLTQGLLDAIEPGAAVSAFIPEDPHRAGCAVAIREPDAAGA
jgi:predicted ArsR family transcriptional regulator